MTGEHFLRFELFFKYTKCMIAKPSGNYPIKIPCLYLIMSENTLSIILFIADNFFGRTPPSLLKPIYNKYENE
jgi:hypothetical protein